MNENNAILFSWTIFEISSQSDSLTGVMLRGRIRKFAISHNINVLVENASDKQNVVRFAILEETELKSISQFIKTICPDAIISKRLANVQNPVLSKIKVNDASRYSVS